MNPVQNLVIALCVAHARLIDDGAAMYVIENFGEAALKRASDAFLNMCNDLLEGMTPQERDATRAAAMEAASEIIQNWQEYRPHRWN